jgi:hypothetical protein
MNPTTCSVIPVIIVNGPIAKQIRLGSGYGLLSPDPQHPAGEAIGRAIRILQEDLGGAIPGIGTMAIFGGMRATNAVFAEDEEGLPQGWQSLSVEQGFKKDQNVVSATAVNGMINILWEFGNKESNDVLLNLTAKVMGTPNMNVYSTSATSWAAPNHTTGVVMIPRGTAASLASASGYSKMDIKTILWNRSKLPWDVAKATGIAETAATFGLPQGQDMPITAQPKQVALVVAGGDQSGHGYWMPMGNANRLLMSAEIKLPKNWNGLLTEAEKDLGPVPSVR